MPITSTFSLAESHHLEPHDMPFGSSIIFRTFSKSIFEHNRSSNVGCDGWWDGGVRPLVLALTGSSSCQGHDVLESLTTIHAYLQPVYAYLMALARENNVNSKKKD